MAFYDSTLYLCKNVDLDVNHEYSIDFDDSTQQYQYFRSKNFISIPNDSYTYIRQNEGLRVDANIDVIFDCNYLYYTNADGKHYYCFITDKKYINEETTELTIKLDVFQTFMFNYELGECFVDRMHEDRFKLIDSKLTPIISYTDEGLNYGDVYEKDISKIEPYVIDGQKILFAYIFRDGKGPEGEFNIYDNGIEIGYSVLCVPVVTTETSKGLYFYDLDNNNYYKCANVQLYSGDDVHTRQIIISPYPPSQLIVFTGNDSINFNIDSTDTKYSLVETSPGSKEYAIAPIWRKDGKISVTMPVEYEQYEHVDHLALNHNYEPKLNNFPYRLIKIVYGNNEIVIRPEYTNYARNIPTSGIQSLSYDGTSILDTSYMKKVPDIANYDHLIVNQLPSFIDLRTDKWETYMLQNKAQRVSGYATAGINALTGITTGLASNALMGGLAGIGVLGAINQVVSSGTQIANMVAKEKDIKNQPDDVRQFNGDISVTNYISGLTPLLIDYQIPYYFKSRIREYLSHYGYKVNDFKVPDIRSRYYFNYIKTVKTVINSNINIDFVNELKEIYQKGITIWHKRDDWHGVNNYDYENAEMSLGG